MQSITFALPTLAIAEMARQDQIEIVVNQATAAIVCCYLEHMNTAINKGIAGASSTGGGNDSHRASPNSTLEVPADTAFLTATELVSLINSVQGALRVVS